jgi:beta-xylosidase
MVEAVMFWNEPNNKSHWDFSLDPEWRVYGEMVKLAAAAVAAENPRVVRVLGGISPIDGAFIRNMQSQRVLESLDAVAVHGFPLDWNHWNIHEWPAKLDEIRAVTDCRSGFQKSVSRASAPKKSRSGACSAPPIC